MSAPRITIKEVATALEAIAPLSLAQDWDNVGLLVGDPDAHVKRVLMTIDTTAAVVEEAIRLKMDLILSYHPVLFKGTQRVTANGPSALIYKLIRHGIGLYSFHTAMDVAAGGVNDALAAAVGIANPLPIGDFVEDPQGPSYKMITFVPKDDVNRVADALYANGAGAIGNYSHCGFQTHGTGTFLPLPGATPTIGKQGQRETVPEIRLETVVKADKVSAVIDALRQAHPYETPAFDVFRHYNVENHLGLGRIGQLAQPAKLDALLTRLKRTTGADVVGIVGTHKRVLKKAAVCAGSCGDIIQQVIAQQAQVYITGELKHHLALHAQAAGLTCVCLSHSVSERFALKSIRTELKKQIRGIAIRLSAKDVDPFEWKTI
jgi:dinuclear metal center YbgI/SA1388 family protein